jgi:dolichyl-phosphate-mannose-protein mannosyltransferase
MQKFNELQSLMLIHNARLTSSHPYSSSPITWPFVVRGISYWETSKDWRQIYVLGNPFIWWSVIAGIFLFFFLYAIDLVLQRRGIDDLTLSTRTCG